MKSQNENRHGFTLIEVIITLVLFGIMTVFLGPLLLRSVTGSTTPLQSLGNEISLQSSMESLISTYESLGKNTTTLASLKTTIDGNTSDYIATTKYVAIGASGSDFTGTPTKNNMLLVTLKSKTTGETLTTLFVATN